MMNILQLQDQLKGLSQEQLVREMQMPSGAAPQYLVLSEITRRKKMQDALAAEQQRGPQATVAQEAIAVAGVPQAGLGQMAQALAPRTDAVRNTGIGQLMPEAPVRGMYEGGYVKKMQEGGAALTDPAIRAMANRMGMSVPEFLSSIGAEEAARIEAGAARRASRDQLLGFEPVGVSTMFPTQNDLNRKYFEVVPSKLPVARSEAVDEPIVLPGDVALPGVPAALPVDLGLVGGPDVPPTPALWNAWLEPRSNPSLNEMLLPFAADPEADPKLRALVESGIVPLDLSTEVLANTALANTALADTALADTALADTPETYFTHEPTGFSALPQPFGTGYEADRERQLARLRGIMGDFASERDMAEMFRRTREIQAPDRSGVMGTNADRSLGPPTSWDFLGATVNIDQQGNISFNPAPLDTPSGRADRDQQGAAAIPTAEEVAAAEEARKINEELAASDEPTGPAGPSGGTGAGGAAATGASSYEQELMDALARADKRATQDKWLALAQAGLAIMDAASRQGTFAGAVGEGGAKGLAAFRQGRDEAEAARLGLMKELEAARFARMQLAMRGSGGGGGGGLTPYQMYQIAKDEQAAANDEFKAFGEYVSELPEGHPLKVEYALLAQERFGGGGGTIPTRP